MIREFGRWAWTPCDECGREFLVTRTQPKTKEGPVVCSECEMYARGYADGYKAGLARLDKEE